MRISGDGNAVLRAIGLVVPAELRRAWDRTCHRAFHGVVALALLGGQLGDVRLALLSSSAFAAPTPAVAPRSARASASPFVPPSASVMGDSLPEQPMRSTAGTARQTAGAPASASSSRPYRMAAPRPHHRSHNAGLRAHGPARQARPHHGNPAQPVTHIRPGDPLLQGPPAGWGAHVLGIGAPEGGKAPKLPDSDIAAGRPDARPLAGESSPASGLLQHDEAGRGSGPGQGNGQGAQPAPFSRAGDVGPSGGQGAIPQAAAPSRNRVLIPVPAEMGIAAYQSGPHLVILVDARQPMDVAALHGDGIFAPLSVTTLPGLTRISLPLPDTRQLYLSQQSDGWVLGDQPPPGMDYGDRREIAPRLHKDGLLFPLRKPGRVFTIRDPVSGTPLLIGTTALDDGGMLSLRRGKTYDVWPSLEGVVIAPHSPVRVSMEAVGQGDFLQRVDGHPLEDRDRGVYASEVDLDWLELRHISPIQAQERYRRAVMAAADAPPAERFQRRFEAAQAALGAGAFPDGRAIMDVALEDDPEEAFRPDIRFFLAAMDLLTGRMKGAAQLDQQWPGQVMRGTRLWQGLYEAAIGGRDGQAAHLLARDMPRLLNYPDALRDVLLPQAAEVIARHGSRADRHALDSLPEGSAYGFVRAVRALRDGRDEEAIHLLEGLSVDQDPVIAEKAMEEGVALSLRDGHLTPLKAARQYASLLPDARLSGRDGMVNMLRAGADIRAGQWEAALQALDQADQAPPPRDTARMQALSATALEGVKQELSGMDQGRSGGQDEARLRHGAALLRAHLPGLPAGEQKAELMMAYGQSLDRLGLDEEGSEVISAAIPMMTDPRRRAAAGDILAENETKRGRPEKAAAILANTAPSPMPPEEGERRNRLVAGMALASGKPEVALYLLGADQTPQAAEMRARIHEGREEWSPAVADLRNVAGRMIPEQGRLNLAQQLLALRLASDASRAGDVGALSWIRNRVGDRPFEGDGGRMFQLLVSPQPDSRPGL